MTSSRVFTAVLTVLSTTALAAPTVQIAAADTDGYVRLAHLSPDTPAVDVYLYSGGGYSGGNEKPELVLRHVAYGALSPYQRLAGGDYSVAMRPADAAASSPPVLSTTVDVQGGQAYTVAGMGPYKGIKLRVLHDSTSLGSGKAALRIIEASVRSPTVDVTADGERFADPVHFPDATPYHPLAVGSTTVSVKGSSGTPATANVDLTAGSLHTLIVLDGDGGLKLVDLHDTAQGAVTPRGGVDTGLGGLALHRRHSAKGSVVGTAAAISAVAALAALASLGLLTLRPRRRLRIRA